MDNLSALSSITGSMDDFGAAAQSIGAANAYEGQASALNMDAKSVLGQGDRDAEQVDINGTKVLARMRSMYSKAGVKFTGSPALVWAESEKNVRLDVLNTKLNAAMKANALGFQALQAKIMAGNMRTQAVAQAGSGILKIVSGVGMSSAKPNMGGGGVSQNGNVYGSNTPNGVRDMGTYSSLPSRR